MWYVQLLYANYGNSLIIGFSIVVGLILIGLFLFNACCYQTKIKRKLKQEINEGLYMNFPLSIEEKMEIGHNPLKKYEIFLFLIAFKLNNMPFRKTPNGYSTFFKAKLIVSKKNMNKLISYTIKEILKLEDKLGENIDFNDIEKYLRKKEISNKLVANLEIENHICELVFYGRNLEKEKHNNLECFKLVAKDIKEIKNDNEKSLEDFDSNKTYYFINNHLKSYELLIHARRKNKLVSVCFPKNSNIDSICHFETRIIEEILEDN